jgi:hypothetical protein
MSPAASAWHWPSKAALSNKAKKGKASKRLSFIQTVLASIGELLAHPNATSTGPEIPLIALMPPEQRWRETPVYRKQGLSFEGNDFISG